MCFSLYPLTKIFCFVSVRRFNFKFSETKNSEKSYDITLSQNMCFVINLFMVCLTKLFLKQNVNTAPKLLKSEDALRFY